MELLALILANPCPSTTTPDGGGPIPGRATLIITPATLLGQYITEIDKCTHLAAVPTAVYVGPLKVNFWTRQLRLIGADGLVGAPCRAEDLAVGTRVLAPVCVFDEEEGAEEYGGAASAAASAADAPALSEAERREKRARLRAQYFEGVVQKVGPYGETAHVAYAYTPEALAGEGIVLATYDTLRSHGQMLKKVAWHRVVVDECQELRVGTSQVGSGCGFGVSVDVGGASVHPHRSM